MEMQVGVYPRFIRCPHCAKWVTTRVTFRYGLYACFWLGLLLLLATLVCVFYTHTHTHTFFMFFFVYSS